MVALASKGLTAPAGDGGGRVAFLSDAALVEGLRARRPEAVAALYDRYAPHVRRLLARVMGSARDLDDLAHDVFVRAIGSSGEIRDPNALKAWMTSIAIHTARTAIQARTRRRWLSFLAPEALPEPAAIVAESEVSEAMRATYGVLDTLPADERVVFALRFIEGMELTAIAEACGLSLATVKRRIARAEDLFCARARANPVLAEWIQGGTRWAGR